MICQKTETHFSGNSRYPQANLALALVETADGLTDTRKSIAGRREMPDCTDGSMLGVNLSRENLQKNELQSLTKIETHLFHRTALFTYTRRDYTITDSLTAEYE